MNKQKGNILPIIMIILLLGGLAAGVYLSTSGNPLKLFSKAGGEKVTIGFDTASVQKNVGDKFEVGVEVRPGNATVIGMDITYETDNNLLYEGKHNLSNDFDYFRGTKCGTNCFGQLDLNKDKTKIHSGLIKPYNLIFTGQKGTGTIRIKKATVVTTNGVVDAASIDSSSTVSYVISDASGVPPAATTPTCAISLLSTSSNNVSIRFGGNANRSGDFPVRLSVERRDSQAITPGVGAEGIYDGRHYYIQDSCTTSNNTACSKDKTISLPAGDYYAHCDINTGMSDARKCSGNPFCNINGAGNATDLTGCNGWLSCSGPANARGGDNITFSVGSGTATTPACTITASSSSVNTGSDVSFTYSGNANKSGTSDVSLFVEKADGTPLAATVGQLVFNRGKNYYKLDICKSTNSSSCGGSKSIATSSTGDVTHLPPGNYIAHCNAETRDTATQCSGNPFCNFNGATSSTPGGTIDCGGWHSCGGTANQIGGDSVAFSIIQPPH